ncbi:MAG: mechanosensitive ion channel [Parasphingorhabdus sp.]|nr:mechanosensitive ion channel [Parasphingorhabdus sp.]
MENMRIGNYAFDPDVAMAWGEKIGIALIILIVTWIVAKATKWSFAKLVDNIGFLQRSTQSGDSLGMSLGKIVSLFIWLFGIIAIMQVFALDGVIAPLNTLLDNVMGIVPGLIGAGLAMFLGVVLAKIVRQLVETTLMTANFDSFMSRSGAEAVTGNATLSRTIGTIIYAIIVLGAGIVALQLLGISVIADPAQVMLQTIFDAVPRIIGAALVLGIGFLIARFVAQLIVEVLPGLGVDRALASTEILPASTSVSSIIARVAQVAIMLFFAIMATRMLQFPEITAILDQVLELGGRVIFGGIIIAVGFLLGNFLARMISSTGESNLAASIVKYATLILFVAMGLKYMGIGRSIIEMAFGALVIGTAVAAAIAFGLGGRETAAKLLEDMRTNPPKVAPPAPRKARTAPKAAARKPGPRK